MTSATDTQSPATTLVTPLRMTRARDAMVDAVDVEVKTYLGASKLSVGELKALDDGKVIRLDSALNAPVELKVNGCTIAFGELVAVGDKFGVRITALAP